MKYLQKRAIVRTLSGSFDRQIRYSRAVVIPSLAEADTLPATLQSLCDSDPRDILADTLILIVVNNRPAGEDLSKENADLKECIRDNEQTLRWLETYRPKIPMQIAWIDAASPGNELPPWGGVGLARKIGCDSVLAFLKEACSSIPFSEFIFFSLDADALISPNYMETSGYELRMSGKSGGVIPFRHQQADSPESQGVIDDYEAFLNDYVEGLRRAGSPYAFHTVGSCLCFTADGYIRANGFSARKNAGEDFYFCMELAKTGGICEIKNTTVFPSARISRRVPFGTGRRMADALLAGKKETLMYDYRVFAALRELLACVTAHLDRDALTIYAGISNPLTIDFLEQRDFATIWERFRKQYKTKEALLAAFHRWFDGFVTLKYIHLLTEQKWPRQPLIRGTSMISKVKGKSPFSP